MTAGRTAQRSHSFDPVRAQKRVALWNQTFRVMFGSPSGENIGGLKPGNLPKVQVDEGMTRAQLVARPPDLRKLLAPIVFAGPPATLNKPEFRELAIASLRDVDNPPQTADDAIVRLKDYATEKLQLLPGADVGVQMQTLARLLIPERLLAVGPTMLLQRRGIATVSRRARFLMDFHDLVKRIDPKNWYDMGPSFEYVSPVEGKYTDRKKENDGWHGLFEEVVVVAWNRLEMQSFNTFLKVDYTHDNECARADYSLVYEVDDQIEEDYGFLEVKRVPGSKGLCEYTGSKSVRLRSTFANLMGPMLAATTLESGLSVLEQTVVDRYVSNDLSVE